MSIYQESNESVSDSELEELKEEVEAQNLIYASPQKKIELWDEKGSTENKEVIRQRNIHFSINHK